MTDRRRKEPARRGKRKPSVTDPKAGEQVDSILRDAESVLRDAESAAAETRAAAEEAAVKRIREADRDAAGLREEAKEYLREAQRQADELTRERRRRIADLSDEMIGRMREAADRTEQMLAKLVAIEGENGKSRGTGRPKGRSVSDGARLLATQMAVSGSSRDEVATRLGTEFGIGDSSAILDDIGL